MNAEAPWKGYKLYKVWHKKQGRFYACLVSDGHRTTRSYARYLMEVKLGRHLTNEETVDHINEDKTDDRIENLQILSWTANKRKSSVKPKVELVCLICDKSFFVKPSRAKLGKTCSRKCGYQKTSLTLKGRTGMSIPHGTKNGYSYHKCRCELCRKAQREYQRSYNRKKKNESI